MKSSNIGGQAVLEGIMMKNKEDYAVAVRKTNGEIEVHKDRYTGAAGKVDAWQGSVYPWNFQFYRFPCIGNADTDVLGFLF